MSKTKELRYTRAQELRIQNGTDGSRTLSGVAVVYNSPSVDMGGWREIVVPGCFTDTLKNSDVLMLRDHASIQLLGREKSGTLTLRDSPTGLNFIRKLPNTTQAADLAESIRRGDLDGVSFGFTVAENGDKWASDGKGTVTRSLLKVDLAEISVTSFPAYPAASVSIRSCPPEIRSLMGRKTNRSEADDCTCLCPECVDGDCADCSDEDCDSDGCSCQNEERSATTPRLLSSSEVNKMYMTLALSERK
jgi:HK97 family phage prohead protease